MSCYLHCKFNLTTLVKGCTYFTKRFFKTLFINCIFKFLLLIYLYENSLLTLIIILQFIVNLKNNY